MKWPTRFPEWLLRFASSQKNIDWVAKWVDGTVSVLALLVAVAFLLVMVFKRPQIA